MNFQYKASWAPTETSTRRDIQVRESARRLHLVFRTRRPCARTPMKCDLHSCPEVAIEKMSRRRPDSTQQPVLSSGFFYNIWAHETFTAMCTPEVCQEQHRRGPAERRPQLVGDASIVTAHVVLPDGATSGLPSLAGTWTDSTLWSGRGFRRTQGGAGVDLRRLPP